MANKEPSPADEQVAHEQAYVDMLFAKLDDEVMRANERLQAVQLRVDPSNPDAEALVERETEYHGLNERIDRLHVAQLGLVFGRIDVAVDDGDFMDNPVENNSGVDRRYIGRMGLDDPEDDYRTLLLDWRAPIARPFYLATTLHPEGVLVRRHIRTTGRTVTGVDDEVLTTDHPTTDDGELSPATEIALHRALSAARTPHMATIVETIQREQDAIIRDDTRGLMIVEGGPGTGKTAVALHRVAYLLYTWREHLAATGVLIIGPNSTFLQYISRVLPELGETGVVLSTVGSMFPGLQPNSTDDLLAQEIKGSVEMTTILGRLVAHHQRLPEKDQQVRVDGLAVPLTTAMVKAARTRARRSRRPHNFARPLFAEALAGELATQMRTLIGADPLGGANLLGQADVDQLHEDITDTPEFWAAVEEYWPVLSPLSVLDQALSDHDLISTLAYDYEDEVATALYRPARGTWSAADAALADELAHLVGVEDLEQQRQRAQEKWRSQVEQAQDALDILESSAGTDLDDETEAEILSAFDVVDAEYLAQRQEESDHRSTAERAQADIGWAYGHVVVDEAQELSPMEWRMVMRRCPSRWMTIVGDRNQTSSPAGVDDWAETLEPFVGARFKRHTLSVNYRTPKEVMDVARQCVPEGTAPVTSLREEPHAVVFHPADTDGEKLLQQLRRENPDRLCCLIQADAHRSASGMSVAEIKGLEFDHVIVEAPTQILRQSPQGWCDLYVALTRATQSLHILGPMP